MRLLRAAFCNTVLLSGTVLFTYNFFSFRSQVDCGGNGLSRLSQSRELCNTIYYYTNQDIVLLTIGATLIFFVLFNFGFLGKQFLEEKDWRKFWEK